METEQILRRRIKTVADLHAIVRTMKALSAVSARQYENVVKSLDEYAQTIDLGLQVALRKQPFRRQKRDRQPQQLAAIIFGSDVGLCGRFNEDLLEASLIKMKSQLIAPADRRILAVGSRVDARLNELGQPVEEVFITPGSASGINITVRQILTKIDEWQDQDVRHIWLFYSQACTPSHKRLLPIDYRSFSRLTKKPWPTRTLPTHTLESEQLLAALIRQYLFISLFRACAESLASEHLMRLRTTQAAEKNIQERHDELSAEFRTRRQDAIDAELLDIGAGFEAVGGNE
ncbi:MAG: F0F1 ATP synthase subunit gamma [Gammaproteobacteria bacterium]